MCRRIAVLNQVLVPDIFGGIAPSDAEKPACNNAGYPTELEKQISYVFTPNFPSSDVEKRGFFPLRELLFGFWVVTVKPGFFSCGSDTVFPRVSSKM